MKCKHLRGACTDGAATMTSLRTTGEGPGIFSNKILHPPWTTG